MLPSELTGLDSTKHILTPSPCLSNTTKCSYQAERKRRLLVVSDETAGLGLGLHIPLTDSITMLKYSATVVVWKCKFKSGHIICLRWWQRIGQTQTDAHFLMAVLQLDMSVFYLSIWQAERQTYGSGYLWSRSNTAVRSCLHCCHPRHLAKTSAALKIAPRCQTVRLISVSWVYEMASGLAPGDPETN